MQLELIAGVYSGIPIRAYPTAAKQFRALHAAARDRGNYWAREAVKTVSELCSGYHKKSVYVTKYPYHGGRIKFNVMMPGCVAKVIQRENGELILCTLTADTAYLEKQENFAKPGYYEVRENTKGQISVQLVSSGKATKSRYPIVVTDQYRAPEIAARAALPYLKKAPNVNTLGGAGMFYTPGDESIGGYKRMDQALNSASDPSLREAAMLLMDLMASARQLEGVSWVSERGGSGVLTQAMSLLNKQGITFENMNHQAFLAAPTTNIEVAERLARNLKLSLERNRYFDALNFNQLIGSGRIGGSTLVSSWERYRHDENHTLLKFGVDVASEIGAGKAAISKGKAVAQAVTFAGGATAAASGSPLIALGLVLAGVAPTAFKSFFPDTYHRVAGKF